MGDERTWTVIQCIECGAVAEPSDESWEGWCSDGEMHGDTRKVAVVEASVLEERDRLAAECCTCEKCGHVQAEPNWCHECKHRVSMPDWAAKLLDELQTAKDETLEAEDQAESLRSQLTEARALTSQWIRLFNRLDAAVARCLNAAEFPEDALVSLRGAHDAVLKAAAQNEGLVPAPQDREPTT